MFGIAKGISPFINKLSSVGYLNGTPPASEYNKNYPKSSYDKVTATADISPKPLPFAGSDPFNVVADDTYINTAPSPATYNATYLKSSYNKTTPAPTPYSREKAIAASMVGEDVSEDDPIQSDPIGIMKKLLDSSTGTEVDFWKTRINKLTRLDLTKLTRPLNSSEEETYKKILSEVTNTVQSPSAPATSASSATVPALITVPKNPKEFFTVQKMNSGTNTYRLSDAVWRDFAKKALSAGNAIQRAGAITAAQNNLANQFVQDLIAATLSQTIDNSSSKAQVRQVVSY